MASWSAAGERIGEEQSRVHHLHVDLFFVHIREPLGEVGKLHARDAFRFSLRVFRHLAVNGHGRAQIVAAPAHPAGEELLVDHPVAHVVHAHYPRPLAAELGVEVFVVESHQALFHVAVSVHNAHFSPPLIQGTLFRVH